MQYTEAFITKTEVCVTARKYAVFLFVYATEFCKKCIINVSVKLSLFIYKTKYKKAIRCYIRYNTYKCVSGLNKRIHKMHI